MTTPPPPLVPMQNAPGGWSPAARAVRSRRARVLFGLLAGTLAAGALVAADAISRALNAPSTPRPTRPDPAPTLVVPPDTDARPTPGSSAAAPATRSPFARTPADAIAAFTLADEGDGPIAPGPIRFFNTHCAGCHGDDGAIIRNAFARRYSDAELLETVRRMAANQAQMPLFGRDLVAQAAFARSLMLDGPFLAVTALDAFGLRGEVSPGAAVHIDYPDGRRVDAAVDEGLWFAAGVIPEPGLAVIATQPAPLAPDAADPSTPPPRRSFPRQARVVWPRGFTVGDEPAATSPTPTSPTPSASPPPATGSAAASPEAPAPGPRTPG